MRPGVQSRASDNGARRSPAQDDWGAKQKKKAPAPKKAAWTGAEYSHCIPAWTHPFNAYAGPEAEACSEAGAGAP